MKNDITPKPILSISMLISGRDEMEKSLKSLQPFKEAFPCEIILVDTGCNEEQRALAERYADKIIDFVWCNDFAAARNAGLSEAKGEWFLYLDDDEWFDDPQQIIAFFTSGEYRNYRCAAYVVRNYLVSDGSLYDDAKIIRMMRLVSGIRFVGRIHEYPDPVFLPRKVFTDFVHHYGYVYKDEAEQLRHAERNIKPLKELMEEEPGVARWAMQLAQEYDALGDYEKVADTCRKWLAENGKAFGMTKEEVHDFLVGLGCAYCYLIHALYYMKRYEEAAGYVEEALGEPALRTEEMEPAIAFVHCYGARICKSLGRDGECCKHFRCYLKYKQKLKDPYTMWAGSALIVSGVFEKIHLYPAVLACMESLILMEEEKLAKKAFYMLDWNDEKLLHGEEWEGRVLDACCRAAYSKTWTGFMQTLVSREGGMKEMHGVFLTMERQYKQALDTEKLGKLRRLVSELEYGHHYILYTKIIVKAESLKKSVSAGGEETREVKKIRKEIESLFAELFKNHPDRLMEIPSEAWEAAEKLSIPMEPLLLKVDYRAWKDGLETWSRNSAAETMRRWADRAEAWRKTPDIRYDVFRMKCAEGLLFRYRTEDENREDEEKTSLPQREEALWGYADGALALYGPLYKEAVLEEIPETLPDEIWIALHLKKLKECRENGDDKGALSALRKCLGVSPMLEKPLEIYAELLKNEIENRNREAGEAKDELCVLVKTLKTMAKQQMEQGNYEAAEEILRQIQACVPEDGEAGEMLMSWMNFRRTLGRS